MNKFISSDNIINDRIILAELRSKTSLLIKRETNLRRLWQSPNLFTPFKCIEMTTVPLAECCDYKSPCNIRKSKLTIPRIAEGTFGLLIQGVFNIDTSKEFKFSTARRYANILKLNLPGKQGYYWIQNDYLYVSDEDVEMVSMFAYPDEDIDPTIYNKCGKPSKDLCPSNPLDYEFRCPSYLVDSVVSMTYDTLMKTYFRLEQDVNSNNLDEEKAR